MNSNRFRLVDAAVVAGVVGVLAALFTPSVLHARAAARLVACDDNFKQIGLALHNYHDVFEVFPPGRIWEPDPKQPAHDHGVALVLLPFFEEAALYNSFNFAGSWMTAANRTARETRVGMYLCPDDHAEAVTEKSEPTGQPSNIAFSLGSTAWATLAIKDAHGPKPQGIFFDNSSVGLRDITDGTSMTLFAAEQLIDRPRREGSAEKDGDCSGKQTDGKQFSDRSGSRWVAGHPSSGYFNARRPPNDKDADCFHMKTAEVGFLNKVARSNHEGGVNALWADGSVRFIKNSIKLDVWQAINTRGGNEPVDADSL